LKRALLGRSRGGLTSKIHLAADRKCRPLCLVLTAGQAADSPQFVPVLQKVRVRLPAGRPRTRPDAVAADKAHLSRGNRAYLRKRNIEVVIPKAVGHRMAALGAVWAYRKPRCGSVPASSPLAAHRRVATAGSAM
jgi:hypothetical protein